MQVFHRNQLKMSFILSTKKCKFLNFSDYAGFHRNQLTMSMLSPQKKKCKFLNFPDYAGFSQKLAHNVHVITTKEKCKFLNFPDYAGFHINQLTMSFMLSPKKFKFLNLPDYAGFFIEISSQCPSYYHHKRKNVSTLIFRTMQVFHRNQLTMSFMLSPQKKTAKGQDHNRKE